MPGNRVGRRVLGTAADVLPHLIDHPVEAIQWNLSFLPGGERDRRFRESFGMPTRPHDVDKPRLRVPAACGMKLAFRIQTSSSVVLGSCTQDVPKIFPRQVARLEKVPKLFKGEMLPPFSNNHLRQVEPQCVICASGDDVQT